MPRSVRRGRPPWSRSDLPPARARTKRLTSWSSNSLSPELVGAIVIWRLSTLHKVQWREQRRKRAHENTDKDLLLRVSPPNDACFCFLTFGSPFPHRLQ